MLFSSLGEPEDLFPTCCSISLYHKSESFLTFTVSSMLPLVSVIRLLPHFTHMLISRSTYVLTDSGSLAPFFS